MRTAGRRMRSDTGVVERRALDSLVVVMRNANINPDVASFLEIEDEPGIFDGFPGCFEKQAVLGVYVGSFTGRNAEKLRIELVDLIEEPGALGKSLSREPWLRIVIPLHVPSI